MTQKEKIELKLEIFEEIKDCMHFNFGAMSEHLDLHEINQVIDKYQYILEGMNKNETND